MNLRTYNGAARVVATSGAPSILDSPAASFPLDSLHVLTVFSDGSETFLMVDDDLLTLAVTGGVNAGEWFGDQATALNTTIGAAITSALIYPAVGTLYGMRFWDGPVKHSDLLASARQLIGKYGA